MNLDDLTIDQLDTMSVELKSQIQALREQRLEIKRVRDAKAEAEIIQAKLRSVGLEGKVVVVPTTNLSAKTHQPGGDS